MKTMLKLFTLMFLLPFKLIKESALILKEAIDRWYKDCLDDMGAKSTQQKSDKNYSIAPIGEFIDKGGESGD